MLNKSARFQKMASLECMRVLKARGYTVTRAGLNFRVITSLGSVSYMTISELNNLCTPANSEVFI